MSEHKRADIEALTEFLQSRGFHMFREMVLAEIVGEFENDITKALNVPDAAQAIDRMRQVAYMRKVGLQWLDWPKRKLSELQQGQLAVQASEGPSRRPVGL